ncbi:hypothetical protein NECAME_08166 [Necator americanus]|uniref:Uncharacterized protein n=1 Tax=Necator americanus TaxID=51031 RepID=W2TLV3_NECAM|nr:hypothetical protein NECAME_08166 [Necator americanus]ETN82116.1 hypothetical protein NECAME_08166 [Necator americanus]
MQSKEFSIKGSEATHPEGLAERPNFRETIRAPSDALTSFLWKQQGMKNVSRNFLWTPFPIISIIEMTGNTPYTQS